MSTKRECKTYKNKTDCELDPTCTFNIKTQKCRKTDIRTTRKNEQLSLKKQASLTIAD